MSETTKSWRSFSWWDQPSLLDQFGAHVCCLWYRKYARARSHKGSDLQLVVALGAAQTCTKKQTWREGGPRLHRVWFLLLMGLELSDYTLTHLLQLKHHRGASSGCNWAVFTEKSVGDVEPEKNLSTYCKSKPICWTRYIQQEFNKMIYFWLFGGNWTCDI